MTESRPTSPRSATGATAASSPADRLRRQRTDGTAEQTGRHEDPIPPERAPGLNVPWHRGLLPGIGIAIVLLVTIQTALVLSTVAGGFQDLPVSTAAALGGQLWLLSLGVPVNVQLAPPPGLSSTPGLVSLVPLGLTAITAALSFAAGRRMARRAPAGARLTEAVATAAAAHAIVAAIAATVCTTAASSAAALAGLLVGGWVVLFSVASGVLVGDGTATALVGAPIVARARRMGQAGRWAGSYLWAVLRAGALGVIAAVLVGSVCLLTAIITGWQPILEVHRALGSNVAGDTALALLHFALLPNLILWATSWATGAGFSIGEGTSITPGGTEAGPLPLLPVLAGLPGSEPSTALLAAPALLVLAGFAAGWWFVREGENHLGEWIAIRIPWRLVSAPVAALVSGLLIGAVAGALMLILASFSAGSLGIGRLTHIGPDPWRTGLLFAAEIGLGVLLAMMLGPWLDSRRAVRAAPADRSSGDLADAVHDELWAQEEPVQGGPAAQPVPAGGPAAGTGAVTGDTGAGTGSGSSAVGSASAARAQAEREREARRRRAISLRRRERAVAAESKQQRRVSADERRRRRRKAARDR